MGVRQRLCRPLKEVPAAAARISGFRSEDWVSVRGETTVQAGTGAGNFTLSRAESLEIGLCMERKRGRE